MVKCLSALEPKITSMAPSTWQKVDEWRQWSLFTGQDRCTATLRLVHPTGVALIHNTKETWRQSSRMSIRNLSCRLLTTWRISEDQMKKPTFTVFLDIIISQLSSFFVPSSIHCLFRTIKRCRFGTDRIWWIVTKGTTEGKLVLMYMHFMCEFAHWRPCLPWFQNWLKKRN